MAGLFNLLFILVAACLTAACAAPYDRYMQEGREFQQKKDYLKAKASFHKAALSLASDAKSKSKLEDALLAEADCAEMLAQDEDFLALLTRAAELSKSNAQIEKAAELKKRMAFYCLAKNNWKSARDYYQEGISDLSESDSAQSKLAAEMHLGLADCFCQAKQLEKAEAQLQKAIETMDKCPQPDNHFQAVALHKLAFIYEQLNRENDAIEADELAKKLELGGIKGSVRKMLPRI